LVRQIGQRHPRRQLHVLLGVRTVVDVIPANGTLFIKIKRKIEIKNLEETMSRSPYSSSSSGSVSWNASLTTPPWCPAAYEFRSSSAKSPGLKIVHFLGYRFDNTVESSAGGVVRGLLHHQVGRHLHLRTRHRHVRSRPQGISRPGLFSEIAGKIRQVLT
jgi:hypothetical protein